MRLNRVGSASGPASRPGRGRRVGGDAARARGSGRSRAGWWRWWRPGWRSSRTAGGGRRWCSPPPGVAAAAGLVIGAHTLLVSTHPLHALAERGAAATLRVVLRDDPRAVATASPAGGPAAARVVVAAELVEATAGAGRLDGGGRVLLLAPAEGWRRAVPRPGGHGRGSARPAGARPTSRSRCCGCAARPATSVRRRGGSRRRAGCAVGPAGRDGGHVGARRGRAAARAWRSATPARSRPGGGRRLPGRRAHPPPGGVRGQPRDLDRCRARRPAAAPGRSAVVGRRWRARCWWASWCSPGRHPAWCGRP